MMQIFAFLFLLLGRLLVCNAGICWRRKNSDGTCSGFLGIYPNQKACCGRGGLAYSQEGRMRAILIQLFVDRPPCVLCKNPCSKIVCENGWTCKVSAAGLPSCNCQPGCSKFVAGPVCSSDGRTFHSRCALEKLSCKQNHLRVEYYGPCKKHCIGVTCPKKQVCVADKYGNSYCIDSHCPSTCPKRENKVCGTDGKTYRNKCALKKASCVNGRKIDFAYLEACRAKLSCKDVQCPKETRCVLDGNHQPRCEDCGCTPNENGLPVCGSDGRKYKSWCHMRRHSCSIGRLIRVNPQLKCH